MRQIMYLLISMLVLAGCAYEQPDIEYSMPSDYELVVYEIHSPNGYEVEHVTIISGTEPADSFEQWKTWRENLEAQDKLNMMNSVWDSENKEFHVAEEQRIEEFCKEWGFEHCRQIDRTCEEEGCHRVTVECDDDYYDEGLDEYSDCRRFEVEVEEDIDDELTEETEEDVK